MNRPYITKYIMYLLFIKSKISWHHEAGSPGPNLPEFNIGANSKDFGTYRIVEHQWLGRACAIAPTRPRLRCSHTQRMDEDKDRPLAPLTTCTSAFGVSMRFLQISDFSKRVMRTLSYVWVQLVWLLRQLPNYISVRLMLRWWIMLRYKEVFH